MDALILRAQDAAQGAVGRQRQEHVVEDTDYYRHQGDLLSLY